MTVATAEKPPQADFRDLLLKASNLAIDQLPLLPVILDRVGTHLAERLRNLSSALPHVTVNDLTTARIGDTLDSYEMRAVTGLFYAVGWEAPVIVGFDRDFVYSAVEMLLGGDGSEPPVEEERNLSSVEVQISQFIFEEVGTALQLAFAGISNPRFRLERTETRMDFAGAGRRNNQAVVAKFILQAINRGGEMFVIIPQSALLPMRQALARITPVDSEPIDSVWTRQMTEEVQRASVTIRAVAETRALTLGDVADLKVGQIVKLQATATSRIKVESAEQPLFWAYLGQNDGCHTLCIDEAFDQQREFINEVLAG
jgi:flagellar motor switch protein FliM